MYHFEYYGYTKAQLEKRGIYGAFEENNYLKVVPDMMDSYKIYKRSRGLRFICYDKKFDRNTIYRQTFFRNNPPNTRPIGKKKNSLWRCCYCGRKLQKKQVEVDHLIPVYQAKRKRYWQKKLPNGVNDKENLVASCRRCNRLKSSKTPRNIRTVFAVLENYIYSKNNYIFVPLFFLSTYTVAICFHARIYRKKTGYSSPFSSFLSVMAEYEDFIRKLSFFCFYPQ